MKNHNYSYIHITRIVLRYLNFSLIGFLFVSILLSVINIYQINYAMLYNNRLTIYDPFYNETWYRLYEREKSRILTQEIPSKVMIFMVSIILTLFLEKAFKLLALKNILNNVNSSKHQNVVKLLELRERKSYLNQSSIY